MFNSGYGDSTAQLLKCGKRNNVLTYNSSLLEQLPSINVTNRIIKKRRLISEDESRLNNKQHGVYRLETGTGDSERGFGRLQRAFGRPQRRLGQP